MELPRSVVIKDSECSNNILFGLKCRYELWSGIVKNWDCTIAGNGIYVSLGDKDCWYEFRIVAFVLFEYITASYSIKF